MLKQRTIYCLIGIALASFLFGCRETRPADIPIDPEFGWFPESPENLEALNTRFDEYDCNIQSSEQNISVYYTSNFEKQGTDLDIEGAILSIEVNEEENTLSIQTTGSKPEYASQILPLVNSSVNDQGPLAFSANFGSNTYFFYAHNKEGQYEIEYLYNDASSQSIQGPFEARVLNSNVCDFYPGITFTQKGMIFSSYRGGKYDLYEIAVEGTDFVEWLNKGENSAILNTTLSSKNDEKCPALNQNLLVFASDREGGYGAYDLWYSVLKNGEWSTPVNFGPDINSEYNEFGPSTAYFKDSKNDMLIFSSNRPGGKGGYDFYFVGIPKMIK